MSGLYTRLRMIIFRAIVVISMMVVVLRLWSMQVVSFEDYAAAADENRYRLVSVDAPRGVIYDRQGRLLVHNVPSFAVSVVPGDLPEDELEREAVLRRVADLLEMPLRSEDGSGIDDLIIEHTTGPMRRASTCR